MSKWRGSNRKQRLPPDWLPLRKSILERDGFRCRWVDREGRCEAKATDVDHIAPGDNHDPANLQSLCRAHHLTKTAYDNHHARRSAIAKAKKRAEKLWGHDEIHSGNGAGFKHPWQ